MTALVRRLLPLALALLLALPGWAQQPDEPVVERTVEVLDVAVKESPPYSYRDEDGVWTGLTVELWQAVARDLDVEYTYHEVDLAGLVDGLTVGVYDVGLAALTITSERESAFDFSHPFDRAGLGIATRSTNRVDPVAWVWRVISPAFVKVVSTLAGVLLLAGALVWLFERRANPEQFGGRWWQGLASGFWWSAVTMTTVGYGDKAPRTAGGRVVALVWMFASIIVISSFTAAIASALTVSRLAVPLQGPEDLADVRVGSVPGSTSGAWLESRHLEFTPYETVTDAMFALDRREVDAVVYDAPMLGYLARTELDGRVIVLPDTFADQPYGFGLAPDSPHREAINRSLLHRVDTQWWEDRRTLYLGEGTP